MVGCTLKGRSCCVDSWKTAGVPSKLINRCMVSSCQSQTRSRGKWRAAVKRVVWKVGAAVKRVIVGRRAVIRAGLSRDKVICQWKISR